jgi:hypothetical protein
VAKSFMLTVSAGPHDRLMCPVQVELPLDAANGAGFSLHDSKTGAPVACQVTRVGKKATVAWIAGNLKAGSTWRITAIPSTEEAPPPRVVLEDKTDPTRVDVFIMGKLFTSYHYDPQWVRPFLHPIVGPSGVRVTRSWPVAEDVPGETTDHPHHKSLWTAYGECNRVDNWSEEPGHGWQLHRAFQKKVSGPVFGQLTARNNWCTNAKRKQFEEIRDLRFYALPGGVRLLDVTVTFRMTEGRVVFRDTKEGGLLSVRVASEMDVSRGGRIENAYGGINEAETWGRKSPWCDYSGVVDGKHVGIAVFDHENNPRYPTEWHVRDYGLMTANCFAWRHYRPEAKVKGDMTFDEGSRNTWRYRVYIHPGDARKGKVAERFADYVAPPSVQID